MGDLRSAYDDAVRASSHLEPVDEALVEAGRKIADRIDLAAEEGTGPDLTKALYLAPHLVNILREMFATPASRRAAGLQEEAVGGKLKQLRALTDKQAGSAA